MRISSTTPGGDHDALLVVEENVLFPRAVVGACHLADSVQWPRDFGDLPVAANVAVLRLQAGSASPELPDAGAARANEVAVCLVRLDLDVRGEVLGVHDVGDRAGVDSRSDGHLLGGRGDELIFLFILERVDVAVGRALVVLIGLSLYFGESASEIKNFSRRRCSAQVVSLSHALGEDEIGSAAL